MKKPIRIAASFAAFLAVGVFVQAQPAIKLITVSVNQAYDEYWKTKEQEDKLRDAQTKAQEQVDELQKQLETLVEEFKGKDEEAKNTALSADARKRSEDEARKMFETVRAKEQEGQQFIQNTQRSLQLRQKNHRDLMIDEINKVIQTLGKAKGATVILDTSGPTGIGISAVLFSDPAYDMTKEVIAELNKSAPAATK